jgi:hypothetical protein
MKFDEYLSISTFHNFSTMLTTSNGLGSDTNGHPKKKHAYMENELKYGLRILNYHTKLTHMKNNLHIRVFEFFCHKIQIIPPRI